MAKLPDLTVDPTLQAMDKKILQEKSLERPRHYLGASEIGHPCWRKLFYSFRKADKKEIDENDITAFEMELNRIKSAEDGHYQELNIIENLRKIDGIKVFNDDGTVDENGELNQIGFQMLLGHFRGHVDGVITGLLQSPKTPHVLEIKCKLEKFVNKLSKLISENGEKKALQEWDEEYFAQAMIYMHTLNLKRHYLIASTPGGRKQISVRTEYNQKIAESIIEKARVIIFENWDIPARISNKPEFFQCLLCKFSEICHETKFPLVHCKTCRYSEPVKDGERFCHHKETIIEKNSLHLDNCPYHIYNPALISAELIEHQDDCCVYKTKNGFIFANCVRSGIPDLEIDLDGIYTSDELRNKVCYINNLTKESAKVQKSFEGNFVNQAPEQIEITDEKKSWD